MKPGKIDVPAEFPAAVSQAGQVAIGENRDAVKGEEGFKQAKAEQGSTVLGSSGVSVGGKPSAIAPDLRHVRILDRPPGL